ncbi:MAG: SMP-30/gluconolactonase/LRE family protein [Planctomycetota bacterium]
MIFRGPLAMLLLLPIVSASANPRAAAQGRDEYPRPPEAEVRTGVPQGKVEGPFEFRSQIFPGTVREFWVYVPAKYDASKPPCLMVVQDGLGHAKGMNLPIVLDNMIHSGEVPVQLGVFVSPGVVPAPHENSQPRFNRSFEYDGLGDAYARFLIDELLPEVAKTWKFSENPDDRCIAGASSGGICAFNAAWERPDAFRRVYCTIGTFVALRGGDQFPAMIRKMENKPIRVFLQDGSNDLDIYAGSWWHANQSMLSALNYAGYDVNHVWGEGGHNGKHGAAVLPDALRWLWRDYPEPLKPGKAKERRVDVLKDGEDWQLVSSGHSFTEGPAANDAGDLFFTDIPGNRIHKLSADGTISVFAENSGAANGLAFGPDGKLYACRHAAGQIVRYAEDGSMEVVCEGIKGNDLIILPDGSGFATDPDNHQVWHFTSTGKTQVVDSGIGFPNGIATSPDQTLLTVADSEGRFCYSWQIQPNGSLSHRQEYGWLHVTDHLQSGADGMAVDTEGRIYVTTTLGVQILDQLGRVNFIIRKPKAAWLSNVKFGGKDRDLLYVTCGDSVFRRRLNAQGVDPWKSPVKPPRPGL